MNVDIIWKIRDARGLNAYDKMFLVTAASHNDGMFGTWQKNCDDMGMRKDRYYSCIKSLTDKELLESKRRFDNTTVFCVNEAGLDVWLASHSVSQNAHSATQNGHSATQKTHSVRPETKENMKGNKKDNLEGEQSSAAGASSTTSDKNEEDKEGREVQALRAAGDSLIGDNSPIALNLEVTPISSNTEEGAATEEGPVAPEGITGGTGATKRIADWPTQVRRSEEINHGLQGNSEGFSVRQNGAHNELTKVVEQHTRAGSLRNDWNDDMFDEALALMLDTSWNARCFKMVDRAYQAYGCAGIKLDW